MEADYKLIKQAVSEAIKEEMKNFYIDREKYYQHHEFIDELIQWTKCWKTTFGKAIANAIVGALIALVIWGFIAWGGSKFIK